MNTEALNTEALNTEALNTEALNTEALNNEQLPLLKRRGLKYGKNFFFLFLRKRRGHGT